IFFRVTAVLLLIFGAAILRYAIHEFEDVGWLPPLIDQVWNTGQFLPTSNALGTLLQALIGYTSNPSLLQMIGYAGYLLFVGAILWGPRRAAVTPTPASAVAPAVVAVEADAVSAEPVRTRAVRD